MDKPQTLNHCVGSKSSPQPFTWEKNEIPISYCRDSIPKKSIPLEPHNGIHSH